MALSSPKMRAAPGYNPSISLAIIAHRFLRPPSLFFRKKTSACGPLMPCPVRGLAGYPVCILGITDLPLGAANRDLKASSCPFPLRSQTGRGFESSLMYYPHRPIIITNWFKFCPSGIHKFKVLPPVRSLLARSVSLPPHSHSALCSSLLKNQTHYILIIAYLSPYWSTYSLRIENVFISVSQMRNRI